MMSSFEAWRTSTDASLGTLLSKTADTASRITELEARPVPPPAPPQPQPPRPPQGWLGGVDLNLAPQSGGRSSADPEERPSGHGVGGGILGPPPLINSAGTFPEPTPQSFEQLFRSQTNFSHHGMTLKMDFPKFDGENPRLWREQCELYFEIYAVSEPMKPRFASLNFTGSAATRLKTVQLRGRFQSWKQLHEAVCAHFDRDLYPLQMKQLENLRQTGPVQEYHVKFEQLAHSILLYNPSYDDVYFVTKFLGGLKEEIRAPITLHRPKDLAEASTLALLQETELSASRLKKSDKEFSKFSRPVYTDKSKSMLRSDELKCDKTASDASWVTLRAQRKEAGLCFRCGEKWTGKNHQCPKHVSLHVVQELLEALQISTEDEEEENTPEPEYIEETVLAVSADGKPIASSILSDSRQTIRFRGFIGKQEIIILLDSGSVRTFVSEQLVSSCALQITACDPMTFSTANGSPMQSVTMI